MAPRATRARQIASYIGAGVIPGQGGGVQPEPSVFASGIWNDTAAWNDTHIWKDAA